MIITDPRFLLAAWSVTTSAYAQYNFRPYTDTPRSRWERAGVEWVRRCTVKARS